MCADCMVLLLKLAHTLKCHADEQEWRPHAEMRLETVKYNELGYPETLLA